MIVIESATTTYVVCIALGIKETLFLKLKAGFILMYVVAKVIKYKDMQYSAG